METLHYILLSNGLLVVVSLAFYALLRRETLFGVNRVILWLGLATVLLLPLAELPDWRPQPVRHMMQRTAQAIAPTLLAPPADITITYPTGQTFRSTLQPPTQPGWPWQRYLAGLYLAGVLVLLVRLGSRLWALRRIIGQSVCEPYTDFTLARNETVTSPFSFFGWVVINPALYPPDVFEHILRHERVHIRGWHSLDTITGELVCILFWFNPAAYLFRHLLHQTLEFTADQTVVAEGVDERVYQYNLVTVSLSASRSPLVTSFGQSALRQRIRMINRPRSGPAVWGRYALWGLLVSAGVLACRHRDQAQADTSGFIPNHAGKRLPATSSTRALVVELEARGSWYQHMALFDTRSGTETIASDPVVVQILKNKFSVANDFLYASALYINGKEMPLDSLSQIAPESISELFVMHQLEGQPDTDRQAKPYQILLQTATKPVRFTAQRNEFFALLQAAAISQHPRGESYMFTMNSLLEATFFHNKNALVERTADEHLKVYDEYKNDVDVFINNLPATVADVATIHVREVARLGTRERPYTSWFRPDQPERRFELHIKTAPKRAKRDSSYYVFSPFYTGDF
ncbi:M56 family metallopeptidase [Spirosoma sordidisoli]|uniref:M56 family metallopeptidase n=1 Tax=Spirosoma sordidisoli TaxID=2502893 RepID=A0A4Q2UH03_9BACT|nr:M56 family metallopeptidase [Spirosoma sordidisoli]RYC68663.1 M56 family metallopeptidase [Spirosoma sordidisoli]